MRFGVKPERPGFLDRARSRYSSSTYKVPSDSEESSSDEFEEEVVQSSDSEDSFCYASESEIPAKPKRHNGPQKSVSEQRELTEAMASIRLHTKYQDPLEEWKKQSKQEAFNAAQARVRETQTRMVNLYVTASQLTQVTMDVRFQDQQATAERLIQERHRQREEEERRNMEMWAARNKSIWEQVDKAAALVEARIEAKRKATEAEVRKREEEQRRKEQLEKEKKEKLEAEKRRAAEEKEKAAQEERRQRELEEKERQEAEEKQRREKDQLSKFDTERKQAGITTPREDWDAACDTIKKVKHQHLKRVKEDSVQRRQWSAIRRGVTLRIGQLTDSDQEVLRISTQIFDTVRALDPNSDIYPAALSALAKAIILQAETEVTAKVDTAGPLAAVAINLFNLPGFQEVLWAKMVTRTGGWLIGHHVLRQQGQDDKEFRKAAGFREDETQLERQTRIGGVTSLFFAICASSKATGELPTPFWPTRIWSFLARIMGDPRLLRQSMAAYLMYACLELAAPKGLSMFGKQWVKLLIAIGQATMDEGRIGASDDAGKTARVRLQLKAEKLLADSGMVPFNS